uniref:Uncharacterized protein n=1 Tax=Rhizophora mucronata TaxID=61149 RepID=A0A2P2N9G2_RHIMU
MIKKLSQGHSLVIVIRISAVLMKI